MVEELRGEGGGCCQFLAYLRFLGGVFLYRRNTFPYEKMHFAYKITVFGDKKKYKKFVYLQKKK